MPFEGVQSHEIGWSREARISNFKIGVSFRAVLIAGEYWERESKNSMAPDEAMCRKRSGARDVEVGIGGV